MAEDRKPRELETREQDMRPQQWAQPDMLPEPDKQPGYAYRWIRVSMLGTTDPRNLSGKLREGWEPVPLSEQPKFRLLADPASRYSEHVEIGGLLLCKTAEKLAKQRNEFYHRQAIGQIESVDNSLMRQSDARMPLFNERRSSTSFGKGN
jgi:hypothetical protein